MADQQGEKTEKPSAKRLKDAREKGQVARSRDLSAAAGTLAATGVLAMGGSLILSRLGAALAEGLTRMGHKPVRDLQPEDLTALIASGGSLVAVTAGPIAFAAMLAGVAASLAQGGFVFAPKALELHWDRLSPKSGVAKLAPSRTGIDTLKALLIAAVICYLSWRIGRELALESVKMAWIAPPGAAARGWAQTLRLLWQTGFALLTLGGADYGVQQWRHYSSLKMTKQEARDESKTSEANPETKRRVHKVRRDMARRRMLQAVPKATVVITNPTHFAVALEYRREKNVAPVVVAKGQDLMAARIRTIARTHGVPIVENPQLARALYAGAEVGDIIPGPLFGAVAEVLAYLIRIKQLML